MLEGESKKEPSVISQAIPYALSALGLYNLLVPVGKNRFAALYGQTLTGPKEIRTFRLINGYGASHHSTHPFIHPFIHP